MPHFEIITTVETRTNNLGERESKYGAEESFTADPGFALDSTPYQAEEYPTGLHYKYIDVNKGDVDYRETARDDLVDVLMPSGNIKKYPRIIKFQAWNRSPSGAGKGGVTNLKVTCNSFKIP